MPSFSISLAAVFDEISDDELAKEVVDRDIVDHVLEAAAENGKSKKNAPLPMRSALADVQGALLGRRVSDAEQQLAELIARALPDGVLQAYAAILRGRISEAVCEVDRAMDPPPSRCATFLPKPRAAAAQEASP